MKWRQRYSVLSILTLTYFVCYVDRVMIAATIPYMATEFNLSPLAMGVVMSAFFFSYAICQIPGGILTDKYGARLIMTIAIVWWSIFTFITGLASSLGMLLVVRALFGIGEAIFPSAATKAISAWFPAKEKGFAYSIYNSAYKFGVACAPLYAGFMIVYLGWRAVFYSMIIPGVLLALLIWLFVKNSPAQSKTISQEELQELENPDAAAAKPGEKVGLGVVLKNPVVWFLAFFLLVFNIGMIGMMSWVPTYLVRGRGFSPTEMAIGTSIPFLAGWVGMMIGGFISDKFFREKRKIPVIVFCPIGAIFLAFVVGAPTAKMCVILQSLALFATSIAGGAYWALVINALPTKIVGSSFGVINTCGQIGAFLAPLMIGYLVNTTGSFHAFFALMVGAFVVASIATIPIKQQKAA